MEWIANKKAFGEFGLYHIIAKTARFIFLNNINLKGVLTYEL
jgi:hypothetical protein